MSDDSRLYKRTIVKDEITSSLLGENRPLRIYLPPGYNELLSYPVIYCQDGEQFFNFGRIATTLTRLILDEDLEPAIVVGVDVNIANRTSEYAPEGERHDAYCQFFADELLPYVESRYPVRTERTERILAGDSLGGTVSLHLALDYPSLFCRVISLSGAFFDITRERIKQEDDLSWLEIYMLIGTWMKQKSQQSAALSISSRENQTDTYFSARQKCHASLYRETWQAYMGLLAN